MILGKFLKKDFFPDVNERTKPLSHRQKQRVVKREQVKEEKVKAKSAPKAPPKGFTDDNKDWLKLKAQKVGSAGESDDSEEEDEAQEEVR